MAYDYKDPRRGSRDPRFEHRDERYGQGGGSGYGGRERDERGFFERAGDEIASWFGDDDDDDRSRDERGFSGGGQSGAYENDRDYRRDQRRGGEPGGFGNPRGQPDERYRASGDRDDYRPTGDYGRSQNAQRERMGRDAGDRFGQRFAGDRQHVQRWPGTGEDHRDDPGLRERAGPSGRSRDRGVKPWPGTAAGGVHDPHYSEWRQRQIEALDNDYEEYRREHQSRFEREFTDWRDQRQTKRQMLGQVREQMEVLGRDNEHVGTVDRVAGDRIILAKNDEASEGAHHSLTCTAIERVEGDKLFLDLTAAQAKAQWRDDDRSRALFEREDQGQAGPHILDRSFSGTYR